MYQVLIVGGKNGVLATYGKDGRLFGRASISPAVDQCDLDETVHRVACAGNGQIDVIQLSRDGSMHPVARKIIAKSAHTLAFDSSTHRLWVVSSEPSGDAIQQFILRP